MYKKIIVPVAPAQMEKGELALKRAKALLDDDGEILLLTVVEQAPPYLTIEFPHEIMVGAMEGGRAKLAVLRDTTGIAAAIELRVGSPAHEILSAATEQNADLIIIASHVPDFSNYLMGATADRVVRHAKCSVLVVR
jgi:universal stress protein F